MSGFRKVKGSMQNVSYLYIIRGLYKLPNSDQVHTENGRSDTNSNEDSEGSKPFSDAVSGVHICNVDAPSQTQNPAKPVVFLCLPYF